MAGATQLDEAKARLYGPGGLGVTNIGVFPGSDPKATPEQVAGEINRSLRQIEAGQFEVVSPDADD